MNTIIVMELDHVLRNGCKIPAVGIGTFKLKNERVLKEVLDTGLKCGYRLIDTAAVYKNESLIRDVLAQVCPDNGVTLEEIYVTSKVAPRDQGYDKSIAAFHQSLENLGRSELDLYLVHWPGTQGLKREDHQNRILREGTWKALEEVYKRGKVRAIGVSNYTIQHLKEMDQYASVTPHLLQSECHPTLPQKELRAYCKDKGIYFQAYSSLGCGQLLLNQEVVAMATKLRKTPAQILLKWATQQDIGVIPKVSSARRVQENCSIFDFELKKEEMDALEACLPSEHHFCWDPTDVM